MSETAILEIGRQAIQVSLMVAMPLLAASLVTGVVVSLVQVATSLQDATLTFVPKIVAVGFVLLLVGAWMLRTLVDFTHGVLSSLPRMVG